MAASAPRSPKSGSKEPAERPEEPEAGAGSKEIQFCVEVHEAGGFPKPECTLLELSGFCSEGVRPSKPLEEASLEQSGWLFPSLEALKAEQERQRQLAEAKSKAKGKTPKADSRPQSSAGDALEENCSFTLPCGTAVERQKALDAVCTPLRVALVRAGALRQVLGTCALELQDLVHEAGELELEAAVEWTPEYLQELREEALAAARAEAAEAAAAAGEEAPVEPAASIGDDKSAAGSSAVEFNEPPPGSVRVRVSTQSGPVGRDLCPEDLDDWAVLTVSIEGCYRPPAKLLEVVPLPEGTVGRLEDHPLEFGLRVLGCSFDGGRFVVPARPPAEEHADDGTPGGDAPAVDQQAQEPPPEPQGPPGFEVGKDEFVEGLMRAGFVRAREDGPAIFEFLVGAPPGAGSRMGYDDFSRIAEFPVVASPALLLELREALAKQYGSPDEAFEALDAKGDGCIMLPEFGGGLEGSGRQWTEQEAEALFYALDGMGAGSVSREDFRALDLHKRAADLSGAGKAARWLLDSCGSAEGVWQQADDVRSGAVALGGWKAVLGRLQYPGADEDAERLLVLLGANPAGGAVERPALDRLEGFCPEALDEAALLLEELMWAAGGGDSSRGLQAFLGDAGAGLDEEGFAAACRRLGYASDLDPRVLFALVAVPGAQVGLDEVAALFALNAGRRRARIAAFKAFVDSSFESPTDAYRRLFDDQGEALKEAEEFEPRIEWTKATLSRYCGREWLQRLLNTLNDQRGRNVDATDGGSGTWLYLFPKLASQAEVVDFKEITDAAQKGGEPPEAGQTRLARWHHGQAWLDLRRLLGDGAGAPEFEFRAFLSQVGRQPTGINEAGDLAAAPFGACHAYVKGTIRLDRPLVQLMPRGIPPLPEAAGEPFVPPPPQKPPPPTASEELVLETRKLVGRLAVEFARMACDGGLEEGQATGPGDEVGPHKLLGRQATQRWMLLDWLNGKDGCYKELAAELRPAIVRLVRSEAKDGPACGISGNKNDALYSSIRDLILKQLFRGLNHEVRAQKQKRDARLWRSPPLTGEADDYDPRFGKPADLAAHQAQQDSTLQRLIFESELLGDWGRATALFKDRLALGLNVEKGETWFEYARFLMRCGQRQLEAEEALRYAISLRPASEGPSLPEAAFLALLLQNHQQPSALGPPQSEHLARFGAARSLLAARVDALPAEQVPLLLLFALLAVEAEGLRSEHATAVAADPAGQDARGLAAGIASLDADAKKYISLARQSPDVFRGTLGSRGPDGRPTFPDLERLAKREQLNRGETKEVPQRPAMPAAWEPERCPVFPSIASVHPAAEASDAAALECIDLMLHCGVPCFVPLLIHGLPQEYGFLSPASINSERCQLQLIRAAMLSADWEGALELIGRLFESCSDRLPEVHALKGECLYRAVREEFYSADGGALAVGSEAYKPALAAFEDALAFYAVPGVDGAPAEVPSPGRDPVLHLRVASIHYVRAEESLFVDEAAMDKAVFHFKQSLLASPTAEAWRGAGVCTYRKAQLLRRRGGRSEDTAALLGEALSYLSEANLLDKVRPQINAYLVMCAVQLGQAQVAKQALREVLRHAEALDGGTARELAQILLEFSDESLSRLAGRESERGRLAKDGRYAREAASVAAVLLTKRQSAEAHFIMGRARALLGEHPEAVGCFCAALELCDAESSSLGPAADAARDSASRLAAEPAYAEAVEEAIARAKWPRLDHTPSSGGTPVGRLSE